MSECPEDTFLDLEAGECKDKKECVDKDGIMYFYDADTKTCDFYCHTAGMYADMASTSTEPRMCISKDACLNIEQNGVKIAFLDEVISGKLRCVKATDCPNNGVDSIYETINDKLHVDLRVAENYTGNNISDSSTYRKCISIDYDCKSRDPNGQKGYHYLADDIWNNTCVRVDSDNNGCGTMVGDDVTTDFDHRYECIPVDKCRGTGSFTTAVGFHDSDAHKCVKKGDCETLDHYTLENAQDLNNRMCVKVDTTSNGCGTGYVGDDVGMIESNPNTNYGHCVSKSTCTTESKGYIDGNKCSSTCSDGKVADKVEGSNTKGECITQYKCYTEVSGTNGAQGFVQTDKKECVVSKDCGEDTIAERLPMVGDNVTRSPTYG